MICCKKGPKTIGYLSPCVTPSLEKKTMYQWTGDMLEERHCAYKSMKDVQGGRVRWNAQMYKLLTQNIQAGCLVWYFNSKNNPWN